MRGAWAEVETKLLLAVEMRCPKHDLAGRSRELPATKLNLITSVLSIKP